MTSPERTLTSSVRVTNRENCVVSIKTSKPIPKDKVFEMMDVVNSLHAEAPVHVGDVLLHNPLGIDTDIVITKNIL